MRDDNRHCGCLEHTARNASLESAPARSDDEEPSLPPGCGFDELIDWVAIDDLALRHDAPPGGHGQRDAERAMSAE
jgi:hypothetical protein